MRPIRTTPSRQQATSVAATRHLTSVRPRIVRRPTESGEMSTGAIVKSFPEHLLSPAEEIQVEAIEDSPLRDIFPEAIMRRSRPLTGTQEEPASTIYRTCIDVLRLLFVPAAAVVVFSGIVLVVVGTHWESSTNKLDLVEIELADNANTASESPLFASESDTASKDSRTMLDSIHASLSNALAEISKTQPIKAITPSPSHNIEELRSKVKFISGLIAMHRPSIPNCGDVAKAIVEMGVRENVDPFFIAAVISIESRFANSAVSPVGARGLMQLMPETAKYVAKKNRGHAYPVALNDTKTNIALGVRYLKQLNAKYRGDQVLTLAAYNWGPGNVDKARSGSKRIPGSVRKYATTIIDRTKNWSNHYRKATESALNLESFAIAAQ